MRGDGLTGGRGWRARRTPGGRLVSRIGREPVDAGQLGTIGGSSRHPTTTFSPGATSFTFGRERFRCEGEGSRTGRESCGSEVAGCSGGSPGRVSAPDSGSGQGREALG